jgi:hypothetical protein
VLAAACEPAVRAIEMVLDVGVLALALVMVALAVASRWTGCRTLAVVKRPGAGRRKARGGTGAAYDGGAYDGGVSASAGPSASVPDPARRATGRCSAGKCSAGRCRVGKADARAMGAALIMPDGASCRTR